MVYLLTADSQLAHMQDPEGNSKGCGIVEFEDPAEALHAISSMSHTVRGFPSGRLWCC